MRRVRGLLVAAAVAAVSAFAAPASAALHLEPGGTFDSPVFIAGDPTNADRLMVVEKDGRIITSGKEGTGTFLDIHTLVSNCNERGLLSMAFAPDYATSGLLYVLYNRSATP